jgi:hypothetical protein
LADVFFSLSTFTFAIASSAKKQACGPEARAVGVKNIGFPISDFELRISDFLGFCFQSAFRNLQSAIPMARPVQEMRRAS